MKSFLKRLTKGVAGDEPATAPTGADGKPPAKKKAAKKAAKKTAKKAAKKAAKKVAKKVAKKAAKKKVTTPPAPQADAKPLPANDPSLPEISIFFEVHQPNRLKSYSFFDIGNDPFYEDDLLNKAVLDEISEKSYLPANALLTRLIAESQGRFRISMSLSGVFLEQLEAHRPDVLKSFQKLYATGGVELVCETYYHSMGFHRSKEEFAEQVELQRKKLKELFGAEPKAFRHTACVYFNELAAYVEGLGFESMLAEAVGTVLQGREANRLYRSPGVKEMKTHLRNGTLSDDIAFRFGKHEWDEHPVTAEKFAHWCRESRGEVVNLFMDYDCLGNHQAADTGIFDFWAAFPSAWEALGGSFSTVSEVAAKLAVSGEYDCHLPTSWADEEKDLSPWKGSAMQEEARRKILVIEEQVKAKNDPELLHQWRKMQTAEHFYYMSTKEGPAGELHAKGRPYPSAYDAYLNFMNALSDLQLRLGE